MSLAKSYLNILEEFEAGETTTPVTEGIFGRKPANMKGQQLAQAKWSRKNMALGKGGNSPFQPQMTSGKSGMTQIPTNLTVHHTIQNPRAGDTSGNTHYTAPPVISFNDFKRQQTGQIHRQYGAPIGPEYQVDPNKPFPGYKGYGAPLRHTIEPDVSGPAPAYTGPTPTYTRKHTGPSLLSKFGRAAGRVGITADNLKYGMEKTASGIETGAEKAAHGAASLGVKAFHRLVTKPYTTRQMKKQTRERIKGRLGLPPSRIVNDIVALKKMYRDDKNHPGMDDFIDNLAHDYEKNVQDLDYSERQALKLAKTVIQRRYKQIGVTLAKQQGRREAWNVIKRTPIEAWNAYHMTREKAEQEARNVRDAELRARSGDVQKHIRDMDRSRDQYLGDLENDIHNRLNARKALDAIQKNLDAGRITPEEAESLGNTVAHQYGYQGEALEVRMFLEGKARSFKEIMRNKGKVRARHKKAMKDRTHAGYISQPRKKGGHKKKKTAIEKEFITKTPISRSGRKTTLAMRKSRIRRKLMKSIEKRMGAVGEQYYGKHPVLHTAGQVVTAPAKITYKTARGAARFTGLDQLPQAARDTHAEMKHQFVHGFLLR